MPAAGLDLAQARILVTNDDGIRAEGLALLERVARSFSKDVWVVAPEIEQSGAGHSLTLRVPLRIRKITRRRFAVDGTPTDCVLLAVREIMRDRKPHLVLSGINRGGNMGEDVTYSGTVAAAMEGTLLDVPSIALSLAVSTEGRPAWDAAERWSVAVIRRLAAIEWPAHTLMNVNIPNLPVDKITGIAAVRQGRRKIGGDLVAATDPRGRPYYWIGPVREEDTKEPGTDIHAVTRGAVAVTPIHLDFTDGPALSRLQGVFA
ncbi:MAG TPA: 5'/3'-nucleotidase SurE [Stellaceae bacterium]|nr:5'/3'-nucleotidase SurE [Stellaceae bacterium]